MPPPQKQLIDDLILNLLKIPPTGFELAVSLYRHGFNMAISVRDEEKSDGTVSRIRSEFPDADPLHNGDGGTNDF